VQQKQVYVANVLNQNLLNINFCRTLPENRWRLWLQLVQHLISIQLKDVFVWGLTTSSSFTPNSMYLDLLDDDIKYLKEYI
jgi:hypothetical protein